uniref:Uncharacterized protein n=1 Tax=Oryza brachyantha TaxID=4533 RepID=J3N6J0_ORYBR
MALRPFAQKKAVLALVSSSLMAAAVILTTTVTPTATAKGIHLGNCEPTVGLPCDRDSCGSQCGALGGDFNRSYCNADGNCCCPAKNILQCEDFEGCGRRIGGCRDLCQKDWDLSPSGAYCKDGLGSAKEKCCCRPNATAAAAVADDVRHDVHLSQRYLAH